MKDKFYFERQQSSAWELNDTIDIKYHDQVVGYMQGKDGKGWTAHIQIPASEKALAKNPNCPWMWGRIKERFDTAYIARSWFNSHREMVIRNLYIEEVQ